MTELTEPWADRAFLRDVQYRTDANLAARQSIYAYQHPQRLAREALFLLVFGSRPEIKSALLRRLAAASR